MIPKDRLWKGIIEDLFPDLIGFFYPDQVESFDFEHIDFLDKELEQLFPESVDSRRFADKLIKCRMKKGNDSWILLHIEVQGYRDTTFPIRMFRYYYRLFDRYGVNIAALAILVDNHRDFHPPAYSVSCLNTRLLYQFETYKLLDYKEEEFLQDNNPFALVMLTALQALLIGEITDERKLELKMILYRKLITNGYKKDKIKRLTTFIKYYTNFDDREFLNKFDIRVEEFTNINDSMGIIETVQDEYRKMGVAEGIELQKLITVKNLLKSIPFLQKLITYEHIAQVSEVPIEKVRQIHLEMKQA